MIPTVFRSEAAIFYLLGYSNDNCVAIDFGSGERVLITDGRYTQGAKLHGGFEVIESRDLTRASNLILRKNKIKKVAIDPNEWSAQEFLDLVKYDYIYWQKQPKLATRLRAIKTDIEIKKIDFACKHGRKVFKKFASVLQTGISEKRAAFEMTLLMNNYGEHNVSFAPIVAFGGNSSLPHYSPAKTKLTKNSPVLVDAGCKVDGYCSDMTRTAFFSDDLNFKYKQKFKDNLYQKAYDAVLRAHDLAIQSARVGMMASELDKIARDVIKSAGFEKEFKHGLGHGVGLEIHEFPSISPRSRDILTEGMVFTIEPGIYLDGAFGARIEDVVVLESGGARILGT